MPLIVLGISAFYHDSAVALLRDGQIVAAAQEERFSRRKHDPTFPHRALSYCLREAGVGLPDVDRVAFYDKPFLKFERLLETYLTFAPKGFRSFATSAPVWLREKLFLKNLLAKKLRKFDPGFDVETRLLFSEHHLSHAASAFFPSPFKEAAVLTLDGVGEWATTSLAMGSGNTLSVEREINFPHSLGLLYSAFTYYTGFRVNSGEYKLMGLAPYGEPTYTQAIYEKLIDVKPDGSFRLNLDYFDYCTGLKMTNDRFDKLFGGPARKPDERLTARHLNIAASIQAVIDDILLRMTAAIATDTGCENLCLAGGVALNCVTNGKILRDRKFRKIWVQPASGDAGGALGAALAAHHLHLGAAREVAEDDSMQGSYLGSSYSQAEIETYLNNVGAKYRTLSDSDLLDACAADLAEGRAIGWFQGRMEFGPRALGARSILGDARSPSMQKTLNLKVKFRESFRPFAPSVLEEKCSEWFDMDTRNPYMMFVAPVTEARRVESSGQQQSGEESDDLMEQLGVVRSQIPAVTHVDYSARLQTVDRKTNPKYHELISRFDRITGCPVIVNTSFNVRGEPIVESPEDAFRCFMGTDIDVLAIGNSYLRKDDQDSALHNPYHRTFAPD